MGITASNYPGDDGGIVTELVPTSSKEWISQHAQACRMSETEVGSMWDRFKELGCNDAGQLPLSSIDSLQTDQSRTETVFINKILKQFPQTPDGGISFQTYCTASKWFKDADIETRVRGAFCVLNNGNPLDENVLREVLGEIYVDTSQAVINRTAQVFLKEVDVKGQGSISEDAFVSWVQRMPAKVVEEIMRIDGKVLSTPDAAVQRAESMPDDRPSLGMLSRVAENARNRDWLLLVNKLGFTELEIREVGDDLGNKKHEQQLFELLKKWRNKTDAVITMATLKDALVSSGMEDVATVMNP